MQNYIFFWKSLFLLHCWNLFSGDVKLHVNLFLLSVLWSYPLSSDSHSFWWGYIFIFVLLVLLNYLVWSLYLLSLNCKVCFCVSCHAINISWLPVRDPWRRTHDQLQTPFVSEVSEASHYPTLKLWIDNNYDLLGQRPGGATPCPHARGQGLRQGGATHARGQGPRREELPWAMAAQVQEGLEELSHITLKVRKGGGEEIPLVQGKEQWLHFAGAAVKRYPMPKVRETQVRR